MARKIPYRQVNVDTEVMLENIFGRGAKFRVLKTVLGLFHILLDRPRTTLYVRV